MNYFVQRLDTVQTFKTRLITSDSNSIQVSTQNNPILSQILAFLHNFLRNR